MKSHEKEQLLTTIIQIDSNKIFKCKNINGLILYSLKKNLEEKCIKNGFVLPNTISIVERSYGKMINIDKVSKIQYSLTYKVKTLLPKKDDEYECIIDSITKMGIISYFSTNKEEDIKNSPLLIIIPREYIEEDRLNSMTKGQKIRVKVLDSRIKYTK